jgi:arabinogalactan endo-1,4-beta-galactosidase
MHNSDLAEAFLREHDPEAFFRDPAYDGVAEAIDTAKIAKLTDALQDFVANVISTILNAGSERDAVNENEALREAIQGELFSWTRPGSEGTPEA